MEPLRYRDTRDLDGSRPTFTETVLRGIAAGGGLYLPESLPRLSSGELTALAGLPYHERAAVLFRLFAVDLPGAKLAECLRQAYGANFDSPRIAPTVEAAPGMHLLELWHGPTSAFKDMALQCMPIFFSEAVARHGEGREYLILVATSGDTGKAALEGFADRERTRIAVFYPAGGVSQIQRRQMVTQRGGNVAVFGVRGNFDDCQKAVKAAFGDEAFTARLEEGGVSLSSANSINWGRLLPQVVYYASAYADLLAAGALAAGEPLDVCVPTGNFGNILAAWYAKQVGTPLGRLICASNENHVLTDFIGSGRYDIAGRPFVKTPSPSMDILVSSNLERLLYELCHDGARVRGWAAELAQRGSFEVDAETRSAVQGEFVAGYVGNDRCLATVREVYEETGRLLDPHTAVAWEAGRRLRRKAPLLVVATAHWAKFGEDVYRALAGIPASEPLDAETAALGPGELLEKVRAMAPEGEIPRSLAELEGLPERFGAVVEGTREGVEGALLGWLP